MAKIQEVTTDRIVDTVYAQIRRLIVRHDLKPGTHLSVPALAEQFGVSRSPVREAVMRAVREGLATEEPRRGAFVAKFEISDLLPLFELREALEGMAARLAAIRRTTRELRIIERMVQLQKGAIVKDNIEEFVEADIAFHKAIMDASQNPALIESLNQLYNRLHAALAVRATPTGPRSAYNDHDAVLSAIAAGDAEAAEAAARHHIHNAVNRVLPTEKRSQTPSRPLVDPLISSGRDYD